MTMQPNQRPNAPFPGHELSRGDLLVRAAALGLSVLAIDAGAGAGVAGAASSQTSRSAAGRPVYVEIDAGDNQEPIMKYTPAMDRKFGINVTQVALPFVGQYEKMVTELISRSGAYDLMFFPPYFLGDFVAKNFLVPIDSYIARMDPHLTNVVPVFRDTITIKNGQRYALPYDGDILYVYYRLDMWNDPREKADFLKKYGYPLAPPRTWDQYVDQARFFNRPPHLYGTAFYGQRGFSYAWWATIWAGLGGHWFDPTTMKTQINSPAGRKALQYLLEMKKVSPPDVLSYGYEELRNAFFLGKVAMCAQWPDMHKKSFGGDPATPSKVVGKLGSVPCPNGKSYMPYSRIGAISASARNPDGAYEVLWYLQQPAVNNDYVTDPKNGVDATQFSDFEPGIWVKRFPQYTSLVTQYAATMRANLLQGFPELSIPGASTYLDKLDLFINQALAGQIDPKVALDSAAGEWESTTDSLDRTAQRQAYLTWISTFRKAGIKY
jgi:multiple sugar transport system substrate-binding protein